MKQVNYAGASRVLTGDVIAAAVIRYAAALHQSRLSDVVSIPTVDEHGQIARVEVLLAPGIAVLSFNPPMSPRQARRVPPEPLYRQVIRAVGLERAGGR